MTDLSSSITPVPKRQFRFLFGTMPLWFAIIGLVAWNLVTTRQLSQLKRETDANRPLPPTEVARQFQENTTRGPISVIVKDVRYAPGSDSYKIDFSWTNATTNETWFSDVKLSPDGYGVYVGQIRNESFIQPLGYKESFVVAIKSPSPLLD